MEDKKYYVWLKVESEKDLPKGEHLYEWDFRGECHSHRYNQDGLRMKFYPLTDWLTRNNPRYLSETFLTQKRPIDTLRQWMAGAGNISNSATELVELMQGYWDLPEDDVKCKIEEYICTEMFKGYISNETPLPPKTIKYE